MNDIKPCHYCRFAAAFLSAAITATLLTACNPMGEAAVTSDTAPTPMTAEQTELANDPVFDSYPFSFSLDDGTEITVALPLDPEWNAEVHLCDLSETDTPAYVILHKIASGTGLLVEEARVFSGADGSEYQVTPINEVLSHYVTVTDEAEFWSISVGGAEYQISKAQFADYPADQLLTVPDLSQFQNFFVENGQLFCRVSFLCAGAGTGYANETLKIRYDIVDGTVTAAEMTFERPENEATETP